MQLSAHIDDFLKYLESDGHTSLLTVKNYNHYLKRFSEFAHSTISGQAGPINPSDINLEFVRKYKLFLINYSDPKNKKPLKKITQNYFMIALRAFLRYMAKVNVATLNADQVKLERGEKRPLKTLQESHLKQLLDSPDTTKIDGIRDRTILETLISSGLLVSELASLNRDTINLNTKEFEILGKGGKKRIVFISDSAAAWLEKYLSLRKDTFNPLFIRFQGKVDISEDGENMRLTTRSIERVVEKYAKALDLPIKATPQVLRHSYAADLLKGGTDIKSVQEMLGHSNISITQVYTHSITPLQVD